MVSRANQAPSWLQFAAWAGCAASAALILLGGFAFGPLAAVPAALLAGAALLLGGANASTLGAAAGLGVWGFVLGWLNRHGPGDVCTTSATATSCTEQWAPWPFWLVGAILLSVAVTVFNYLRRRSPTT